MNDHRTVLAASRAEIALLARQPISEVTPSRRDFAMFVSTQRQELAVIARLLPADTTAAAIEHARACDDAEVAAITVYTGEASIPLNDFAAIAGAVSAPLLRENLVLHPSQLHHARLHGADATVLATGELDSHDLDSLVATARSLHMATVAEVTAAPELTIAAQLPHVVIGLRCVGGDGRLDLAATLNLACQVPARATLIVLAPVRSAADCAALRGHCDAVCVTLQPGEDVAMKLRGLCGGSE
jgi:indole-3-glycerol phosphate synthase